ncbi:hypothetical protein QUA13_31670, partial [Microcoleus sp. S28C3]|uniref:hypothetical protein n=1 Tax=Microcoleus sp. S28C3 TaxID=3055414 RepID=UPI002FD76723
MKKLKCECKIFAMEIYCKNESNDRPNSLGLCKRYDCALLIPIHYEGTLKSRVKVEEIQYGEQTS